MRRLVLTLIDDGTLDTVIEAKCPTCGDVTEHRFSQDVFADKRMDDGEIFPYSWEQLTDELTDEHEHS